MPMESQGANFGMSYTDFELDGDTFFPKKVARRAMISSSVAIRKLFYLEEAMIRAGAVELADRCFEIRCTHIRAMTAIFIGEVPDKFKCVKWHYEMKRVTVCKDST